MRGRQGQTGYTLCDDRKALDASFILAFRLAGAEPELTLQARVKALCQVALVSAVYCGVVLVNRKWKVMSAPISKLRVSPSRATLEQTVDLQEGRRTRTEAEWFRKSVLAVQAGDWKR